jgi:hypothetical protein
MMRRPDRRFGPRWCRPAAALAILCAALLAGCHHEPARPAWVDQPGLARPEALYLTAVGAGGSRSEAADAALARLAQRITVDVEARETARSTYVADTDDKGISSRQRVQLDRTIDLGTGVLLMGSEVIETWEEPRGGFFALAVLDRAAAAAAYDGLLSDLADEVREERPAAGEAVSPWSRFVRLSRALRAAEEHDELLAIRSVVWSWPSARGGPRVFAPGIAAERSKALDELAAVVEPAPGTPAAIASIVRDALAEAGIAVRPQASGAVRVRVSYETGERPFAARRDHVVEWRLTVELADSATGGPTQGLSLDGDGWGATEADASAAALHRAQAGLRRELARYLQELVSPPGRTPQDGDA